MIVNITKAVAMLKEWHLLLIFLDHSTLAVHRQSTEYVFSLFLLSSFSDTRWIEVFPTYHGKDKAS